MDVLRSLRHQLLILLFIIILIDLPLAGLSMCASVGQFTRQESITIKSTIKSTRQQSAGTDRFPTAILLRHRQSLRWRQVAMVP